MTHWLRIFPTLAAFLAFATARAQSDAHDVTAPKTLADFHRRNEVVNEGDRSQGTWSVNTYYAEDREVVAQTSYGPMAVQELYASPIQVKKVSDSEYQAQYYGPLYSQCTGGACKAQKWSLRLDACGRILDFDSANTTLAAYNPSASGNHTPISQSELDRIKSYANNPAIMGAIYPEVAGEEGKSDYVLGNSVAGDAASQKVAAASKGGHDPYQVLGGTRWALNPWATNTFATFFIHLDILRTSLGPLADTCPKWPRFAGRTPIPSESVDLGKLDPAERLREEAKRKRRLAQKRLHNFEVEKVINAEAAKSPGLTVMNYRNESSGSDLPQVLSSEVSAGRITSAQAKEIQGRLSALPEVARNEYVSLSLSDLKAQGDVEKASALVLRRQEALKDGVISAAEQAALREDYLRLNETTLRSILGKDVKASDLVQSLSSEPSNAQEDPRSARRREMLSNLTELLASP